MDLEQACAIAGSLIGAVLMFVGRTKDTPKELRLVGGFLLVAGFCYLLGLKLPDLW